MKTLTNRAVSFRKTFSSARHAQRGEAKESLCGIPFGRFGKNQMGFRINFLSSAEKAAEEKIVRNDTVLVEAVNA